MRHLQDVHRHRRRVTGTRHRREHGDLQLHGSDRVPAAARSRSGIARRHEMARQGLRAGQVGHEVDDGRIVPRQGHRHRQQHLSLPGVGGVSGAAARCCRAAFCYLAIPQLAHHRRTARPNPVKGQYVSGGYFAGMGVVPVAGRLDSTAGRRSGPRAAVAVLSERFGRRRFGDAGGARLDRPIRLNDKPFTVIGVAPAAMSKPRANPKLAAWSRAVAPELSTALRRRRAGRQAACRREIPREARRRQRAGSRRSDWQCFTSRRRVVAS